VSGFTWNGGGCCDVMSGEDDPAGGVWATGGAWNRISFGWPTGGAVAGCSVAYPGGAGGIELVCGGSTSTDDGVNWTGACAAAAAGIARPNTHANDFFHPFR
jgi:hypothetical protein